MTRHVAAPDCLDRLRRLVLLQLTTRNPALRPLLDLISLVVEDSLLVGVARVAQPVPTLTTVGLRTTGLTRRPADTKILIDTANTENLCRTDGTGTTRAGWHLGRGRECLLDQGSVFKFRGI
jgi:hypothetical protein